MKGKHSSKRGIEKNTEAVQLIHTECESSEQNDSTLFVMYTTAYILSASRFLPPQRKVMFLSLFVCLFVCLLATLRKNFLTDFHEICREGWQWADEQTIEFWWRSGSPSGYRIVYRIRHYWEIRKVVSTDCAACTSRHDVTVIMSPGPRQTATTDVPWRRYTLSPCF